MWLDERGHPVISGHPSEPEEAHVLPRAMESLAHLMRCARGQTVHAHAAPAKHLYCLTSGMARKYKLKSDGRRQIVDFLLPGDFFGLTTRPRHAFTVEAVTEGTLVACYARQRLDLLANADLKVGQFIREIACETLSRLQKCLLVIGHVTARRKVGAFIAEMEQRLSVEPSQPFTLMMSRYDIADYLTLSVETVSRALTDLKQSGAISLHGQHRVTVIDRTMLEDDDEEYETDRFHYGTNWRNGPRLVDMPPRRT
jgi:CRP/FNR family nitrogen fixation transcriptional regulator